MQVHTHGELSPTNLRLIHDLEASGFRSNSIAHHTGFPLSQVNAVLEKGLSHEDLPRRRSGSSGHMPVEHRSLPTPRQRPNSGHTRNPLLQACQELAGQQPEYSRHISDALPGALQPRQIDLGESGNPLIRSCQELAGQESGYSGGVPERLPDVEQLQQAEAGLSSNPLIRACQKLARESEEAMRLAAS